MTEQEQRIAIAEACGWTKLQPFEWQDMILLQGYNLKGEFSQDVPDYLHDLNAMWAAEECLKNNQSVDVFSDYCTHLNKITNNRAIPSNGFLQFRHLHATAAQRAEAFLRTLNLWKD